MRDFAILELANTTTSQLADINSAILYHLEWFRRNAGDASCSVGFIIELAVHTVGRGYNVHAILDEIAILEGRLQRRSLTKPATKFRHPPLMGLWHKHHNQAVFMAQNVLLEINKPNALQRKLGKFVGMRVGDVLDEMLQEIVDGSYSDRANRGRLTGEFIVFERNEDGKNRYLTLGNHGTDSEIFERIEFYKTLDTKANQVPSPTLEKRSPLS